MSQIIFIFIQQLYIGSGRARRAPSGCMQLREFKGKYSSSLSKCLIYTICRRWVRSAYTLSVRGAHPLSSIYCILNGPLGCLFLLDNWANKAELKKMAKIYHHGKQTNWTFPLQRTRFKKWTICFKGVPFLFLARRLNSHFDQNNELI